MSELDRLREQLVYLRFWLGIMVATEIALVGWLISTPINAKPALWFIGAFGAVLLGAAFFSCIGRSNAGSIKLVNSGHGVSPRHPSSRCRGALRRHRTGCRVPQVAPSNMAVLPDAAITASLHSAPGSPRRRALR